MKFVNLNPTKQMQQSLLNPVSTSLSNRERSASAPSRSELRGGDFSGFQANSRLEDQTLPSISTATHSLGFRAFFKRCLLLIALMLWGATGIAQNIAVKGTVKDSAGEAVIGATVIEKSNPANGTSTDIDGGFSLNVPKGAVVEVSYIGFATQEFTAVAGQAVNIVLQEDALAADEVVVIGYASVVRKDLTGSVGSISGAKLAVVPVASAAEALQGKIAGVQVTTVDGAPGAEVDIRIRGAMDLTGTSKPLFIVDGFPADNINDIPPTDIQSIDVLKDASLTAIYGARGAHGVVMVTTKSAQEGAMKVDFNFSARLNKLANKLEMMNTYEFARYQLDNALIKGGASDRYQWRQDFGNPWDLDLYQNLPTYDWQDAVMGGTPVSYNYNVTVNGGTDKLRFNASLTHNKEEGILLGSGVERTNLNLKVNAKLAKNLTLLVNPRFTIRTDNGAGADAFGKRGIIDILRYRPTNGMREFGYVDPEYADPLEEAQWAISNPVNDVDQNYREKKSYQFVNQASLEWKPIEGLRLRSEFSHTFGFSEENRFYGYLTNDVDNSTYLNQPYAYIKDGRSIRYTWTNTASYNFTANEDHNFSFLLGQEIQDQQSRENMSSARFFPQDITPEQALSNLGLGTAYQVTSSEAVPNRTSSFFTQVNYNYKRKYYISGTFRADGSSKFAEGKQWGYFPSISGAWAINEENFLKDSPVINQLKLRAAFGMVGNNAINSDQWRYLYSVKSNGGPDFSGSSEYGEQYYVNASGDTFVNRDIKWETTVTRNVAIDLGLFRDRLVITPEVYWNTTHDMLYTTQIPITPGYRNQVQNIGQVTNKGIDLTVTGHIVRKKDFELSATFTMGHNKSKVDKLNGDVNELWATGGNASKVSADGEAFKLKVGEPIGILYGYVYDGVYGFDDLYRTQSDSWSFQDPTDDSGNTVKTVLGSNDTYGDPKIGMPKFKNIVDHGGGREEDVNIVDKYDKVKIGDMNPTLTGGFSLNGRWKNLDFTANFTYMLDFDVYNAMGYTLSSAIDNKAGNYMNVLAKFGHQNRWNFTNDSGERIYGNSQTSNMDNHFIPINQGDRLWAPQYVQKYIASSYFVEDGSFLRLSDITVGYTLPQHLTKKAGIQRLRIYFTGSNLWLLTGYSGYDPEVDVQKGLTPGVDYNKYPRSRGYMFGANLSF